MPQKHDWDHEFPRGKMAEELVEALALAEDETLYVETKCQDFSKTTLYIETEQDPRGTGDFIPSGLSVTKADYWAIVRLAHVWWVPVEFIRRCEPHCQRAAHHGKNPAAGDISTRGFKLPLAWLVRWPPAPGRNGSGGFDERTGRS